MAILPGFSVDYRPNRRSSLGSPLRKSKYETWRDQRQANRANWRLNLNTNTPAAFYAEYAAKFLEAAGLSCVTWIPKRCHGPGKSRVYLRSVRDVEKSIGWIQFTNGGSLTLSSLNLRLFASIRQLASELHTEECFRALSKFKAEHGTA